MKSHDCHVFTECLLLIAFRSLPNFVWSVLAELSQFLEDLYSNTLRTEDVVRMQENISIIICIFERIFPPAFFDSMENLVIHFPIEVLLDGLVHYCWMYPFER